MLFKKKKKEEQEVEVVQDVEYNQDELQLIHNLVEDFEKAPGQLDMPIQDEALEAEPGEGGEEGVEEAEEPVFTPRSVAEKPVDLGEFDDLADIDLDSLETTSEEPAPEPEEETPEFEEPLEETPSEPEVPATDEFDLGDMGDLGEEPGEETPAEETPEFDLGDMGDLGEPTSEAPSTEEEPSLEDEFDLGEPAAEEQPAEETPEFDLGDMGDFGEPAAEEETPSEAEIPPGDEFDLGDMGDLGEPAAKVEEAGAGDFDFGDLEIPETPAEPPAEAGADEFDFGDIGGDIGGDLEGGLEIPETPAEAPSEDFGVPKESSSGIDSFSFDDLTPPSLDDVSPEVFSRGKRKKSALADELSELAAEHTDDEISNAQLAALRANLKSFSPAIRQNTINVLLENKLKREGTSELIRKLIEGANELEIKRFIEDRLGEGALEEEPEMPVQRPVVVSRKRYTEKGIHRQETLVKFLKFAVIFIPLVSATVAGTYLFGIKKILYNRDIAKGREIILSQTFTPSEIPKAELFFEKAVNRYPEKSKAYLQYADAYRRKGLYENSFEKLFGKVILKKTDKAIKYEGQELNSGNQFWGLLQKVPIIRYADKSKKNLIINNIQWTLEKPGAYIRAHLDKGKDEAIILYALGDFHSSPARKFVSSPYRNNRLGIDYYNRILNFKNSAPMFQAEKFISRAILGIGDVYYHNADYNKAHDYFEKIVRKDPKDVNGQTGMLKTLIKMYESSNYQIADDPRLIIQQHSLIKHTYKIENKLPLYMLAKLARFYIDLPDKDDLRINYNTSPVDRVNNKALKTRAEELLNIMYNKTDEDIYGNKISGKTFAEGYYQRGRYFRLVVKEYRMAMSQLEYAYKYDPDHFMALNDRAEILMELNDYEGAKKHLLLAEEKLTDDLINRLGDRPEDETLLDADRGIVSFNLAKAMYLSRVKNLDESHDWFRIQEADKFENADEYGKEALIGMLDQVDMYMDKAESQGLRDSQAKTELAYYRGWIHYLKNDYARSLYYWQTISPAWDKKLPNLELAKSYSLYYLGTKNPSERKRYLETSLSHLYYLQSKYAPLAEKISKPKELNKAHDVVFSKMAIIENNMGAIFELMGQEDSALKHYQKSIHYSKKINKENEIANLNIRLAFKRKNLDVHEKIPLIMDFISPYLEDNSL